MKRFDLIKTIQLIILIVLVCGALEVILHSPELFHQIAADPQVPHGSCCLTGVTTSHSRRSNRSGYPRTTEGSFSFAF